MKFDDFTDAIYAAGWRNPNDAQSTNIRALWESLFPTYVEMERIQQELDKASEVLLEIGHKAHDASTGPTIGDAYWEIRNMAYYWEKQ